MPNSSQKFPPGLIAAITMLLSLLVFVFYLSPLKEDIKKLQSDLIQKQTVLAQAQEELKELENLEKSLPKSEIDKQRFLAAVPQGLNQDDLILDFERLAKDNEIIFDSLSFGLAGASEYHEKVRIVNISSTFRGTDSTLIKFLQALENNPRKIVVNSISVSLSSLDQATGLSLVSFSLSMKALYQDGVLSSVQ